MCTATISWVRFPDISVLADEEALFDIEDAVTESVTLYEALEDAGTDIPPATEEVNAIVEDGNATADTEDVEAEEIAPPDMPEVADTEQQPQDETVPSDVAEEESTIVPSLEDTQIAPPSAEEINDTLDADAQVVEWEHPAPEVQKMQTTTLYDVAPDPTSDTPLVDAWLDTAFNIVSQEITVTMPVDIEIRNEQGDAITKTDLQLVPDLWSAQEVQAEIFAELGAWVPEQVVLAEEDSLFGDAAIDALIEEAQTIEEDTVQLASTTIDKWPAWSTSFEFGLPGEHLLFSAPVMIEYAMPFPDGTKIEISTYHAGDTAVWDDGLATQAWADCIDNGDTTQPGNVATVIWGRARFYTCGASTFFFTYTWGANTGNFVDNGTLGKTVTITTWDVGTWFTIQKLIVIVDFQPIDSENPLVYWTTNAYSSEKSFTITSPGGTTRTLVAAWGYTNDGPAVKVRAVFDDQATGGIGALPATGTFLPNQTLSVYSGVNPVGTWTLTMWDNANQDGVILRWFQLQMANVWCGDGTTLSGEACDDGNNTNGDGCGLSCTVEPGYTCTRASPSVCTPTVGATGLRLRLDGSSSGTTFFDVAWSGFHWSGFNGVTTGVINGETYMCFNGVNTYIQVNTWLITAYPFTMSAWVRTASTAINGGIISLANSAATNVMYNLEHNNTTPRTKAQNTVARLANGTTAMNTTDWYLLTARYVNTTSRQIFVNGIQEWTNANNVAFNAAVNRINIGRFADSTPTNYFSGCVDDVRVYASSLSTGQIYDLYARPATLTTSTTTNSSPLLTGTMLWTLDRIRLTISGTNYTWANLWNGTWTLTWGQISPALTSGTYTVTMLVTNPYNRAVTYTGYFIYSPPPVSGSVSISSTGTIIFPDMTTENYFQTGNVNSSDYLSVTDTLGASSGYYTTLQITALSGVYTNIPTSRIAWQATGVILLSGSANPAVTLGSAFTSFSYATGTATFLKRDAGTGAGIYGTYGSILQLRVDIPAYSIPDVYSGTLTYTLFEN
jgi:cysteine-rich repeat protein